MPDFSIRGSIVGGKLRSTIRSDGQRAHFKDKPAPWLDPADIAEAERRNSRSRFMRLWWGVWATGAGDAIDPDDLAAAVDPFAGPMYGVESDFGFGIGLDLGIRRDHSAACVLGFNWRTHRVHLAACESWALPPPGGQIDLIAVQTRASCNWPRSFTSAA